MNVSEINKKASSSTKWSAITETALKLISPITTMILARLLTPEVFGIVAIVTMITSFADLFADAGFNKYLVNHDFDNDDELNKNANVAFWTNISISALLWITICIFSKSLASLVGIPGMGSLIIISSISLLLTSFSSIQLSLYHRNFEFKKLFYIRILIAFVPFLVTIPLAIITRSHWALILGTLSGNFVNAIILTVKSNWKPRFFYDFKLLKEMFSYSWWILLESITSWLSSYIGTFIVGIFLSSYYVGLYKTSISTVGQIMSLIVASTSAPLFAALSRIKNDNKEIENTYITNIRAISMIVIPLGLGIFLYKDLVTAILLGKQWYEASTFVGLWGLTSSFVLVLGTYCNGYFNAKGKTFLSLLAQVIHLFILLPTLFWSSSQGYDTLCVSHALVRLTIILIELTLMKIFTKFPILSLLKSIVPSLICSLIMGIFGLFVLTTTSNLILHLFSILICVIIYFLSYIIIFKKTLFNNLSTLGINIRFKQKD